MSSKIVDFKSKYGPTAVVTGASKGIGKEFARQLAQRGLDVVIVARGEQGLMNVADEISAATGQTIIPICGDIADPQIIEAIIQRCADLEVGLLINNASGGKLGSFLRQPEPDFQAIDLNIKSPLVLTHHFSRKMARRGRGGIIFLSGLSAYGVAPNLAHPVATNAYRLSLGESLHYELKDSGVDVSVLIPGPVRTPGHRNPDLDFSTITKNPMEPDVVVKVALDGLGHKAILTPGRANRVAGFMIRRVMPRARVAKIMGGMFRKVMRKDLL